jgi:uncharacterized protein
VARVLWTVWVLVLVVAGCGESKSTAGTGEGSSGPAIGAMARTTEEKFVSDDGLEIVGTLQRPKGFAAERFPAVLILPGFGPTDADGNQTGDESAWSKTVAESLAELGVASFRFSKRWHETYAKSRPNGEDALRRWMSWDSLATDVRDAYRYMASNRNVDPAHCGIVAMEEGALLALQSATVTKPNAVVVVGTPAGGIAPILRRRLSAKLRLLGQPSRTRDALAAFDAAWGQAARTGRLPESLQLDVSRLLPTGSDEYVRQAARLEGAELLRAYQGPVLVLHGNDDPYVDRVADFAVLERALRGRRPGSYKSEVFPLASQYLYAAGSPNDSGADPPIVPEADETIKRFLIAQFGLSGLPSASEEY